MLKSFAALMPMDYTGSMGENHYSSDAAQISVGCRSECFFSHAAGHAHPA